MSTISIIVPVYDVEEYLCKCIDSILAQIFEDFELILIDDKSPDKSGVICDEYAKKDNRIRVIHKESNQGVSAARNDGLDAATGDYVTFVDSDDWIEPDYLEHLYRIAVENGADIVTCTLVYDGDVQKIARTTGTYEGKALQKKVSIRDADFSWGKWFSFCGVACKLYSREIVEKNKLRFDPSFNNSEDTLFYADAMLYSKKCIASTKALYHYYMRKGSASNLKTIKHYVSAAKAWYSIMMKLDESWNSFCDSGRMLLWNLYCGVSYLAPDEKMEYQEIKNFQMMFRSSRRFRHTQGNGIIFELLYFLLERNIPMYLKIIGIRDRLCKK